MRIVQIWFGKMPKKNKVFVDKIKKYCKEHGFEYNIITGKSYGSVDLNRIASNMLRLEVMKTCKDTLYLDCDIEIKYIQNLKKDKPSFGRFNKDISDAIMYSGDTTWFRDVLEPKKTVWGLFKVINLKRLRQDRKVDIIPDEYYEHKMYSLKSK